MIDGLEISEVYFSKINFGDRFDSEYFTKEYLCIENKLRQVSTEKLGLVASTIASAFYPAATDLYEIGDTAFVRCVDCIDYPIITKEQDCKFEKIPREFGKSNKGIAFLKQNDLIITKVGSPCFTSIVLDYDEIALSRTVLGIRDIKPDVNPYYLMVFLRSKYGFGQLYRQRELTIQYQLTLPRVKSIDIFIASPHLQKEIHNCCIQYLECIRKSILLYRESKNRVVRELFSESEISKNNISIKSIAESFNISGRLDAEYYQPKYDELFAMLSKHKSKNLGGKDGLVSIKKSIEPGSEAYKDEGIPFVRVSDIDKFEITSPEIKLPQDIVPNIENLYPKKDTILLSKDGSVGIAHKVQEDLEVVTSGALLHLTVKNINEILPDYLTLVLNSPIVQLQAERDCNGAIIQHWKPADIEKVVIPVLDMEKQIEIADKVQESFRLRKKSKELLEIAVKAVELAIETDEATAIAWLKGQGV